MNRKEKTENEGQSKEAGFGSPDERCQAMFENMRKCCGDMDKVFACCSMMRKMEEEEGGKPKESNLKK